MVNLKHMIDQEVCFVHGELLDTEGGYEKSTSAVVAISDRYREGELVDMMSDVTVGTHYGLALPPGVYQLLALDDKNGDGFYDSNEIIGNRVMTVEEEVGTNKVKGNIDIELGPPQRLERPLKIAVKTPSDVAQSLFYPAGTIRSLDDPLFDPEMATLGMYNPAAFIEKANTMFYALEEDFTHKIPVIFVHGINGSARDFESIVSRLDRTRFKPWFFHYPSGGDLSQLAQLFYNIFFSGKLVGRNEYVPTIVVAHSMGGIVVREAINLMDSESAGAITFISMASPFGGHPAAAKAERSPLLVLPSWRDLDPDSRFIQNLFRREAPSMVEHHLLSAFGNTKSVKFGENSDGVVPLSSQLHEPAQRQAFKQLSINTSHTGILIDESTVEYIMELISQVKADLPSEHMFYCLQGGFNLVPDEGYSPKQRYLIRSYGKYLRALALGEIEPLDEAQRKYLRAVIESAKPRNYAEKGWVKFIADHPSWREM